MTILERGYLRTLFVTDVFNLLLVSTLSDMIKNMMTGFKNDSFLFSKLRKNLYFKLRDFLIQLLLSK